MHYFNPGHFDLTIYRSKFCFFAQKVQEMNLKQNKKSDTLIVCKQVGVSQKPIDTKSKVRDFAIKPDNLANDNALFQYRILRFDYLPFKISFLC